MHDLSTEVAAGRLPEGGMAAAFYGEAELLEPASVAELADAIRHAESSGRALIPAGKGTHAFLGNPPPPGCRPLVVSSARLASVLRYEPDDFTIGVQAGLPLDELRELLARHSQEVAVDFPRQAGGTVGGLVAAAVPGPRRGRHGAVRSAMIGISGLRGGGSLYKAGGMVVKNVAGYEVAKLLAGSLGTLGPILEVNFKLRPLPARRAGGLALFAERGDAWRFAVAFRRRRLEPAVLQVLDGGSLARLRRETGAGEAEGHAVLWFFEGNASLVSWLEGEVEALAAEQPPDDLGPLEGEVGEAVFDFLCRAAEPIDAPARPQGLARLSVLPSDVERVEGAAAALLAESEGTAAALITDVLAGQITVRWEGPLEELEKPAARLRELARSSRGAGWLGYLPPAVRGRWSYLLSDDPAAELAGKVRGVFDPAGVFCPGRLHAEAHAGRRAEPA
jgi:FAD/FMN-containing dehydrogenase